MAGEFTKTISKIEGAAGNVSTSYEVPRLIMVCEYGRLTVPGLRVVLGDLQESYRGDRSTSPSPLLLNTPSPTALLRLIAQRFPERDALDAAFLWVEALCVRDSPVGLTVNRTMQRMAHLIVEGRTLEEIGCTLDATRRAKTTPAELAAAEAALRSTFLEALFLRVIGRRGHGLATCHASS